MDLTAKKLSHARSRIHHDDDDDEEEEEDEEHHQDAVDSSGVSGIDVEMADIWIFSKISALMIIKLFRHTCFFTVHFDLKCWSADNLPHNHETNCYYKVDWLQQ